MRLLLIILLSVCVSICIGQKKNIVGTFTNEFNGQNIHVTFNADSTFQYTSIDNPVFFRTENFSETGRWIVSGDTVILNPQLVKKPFVESSFEEQETSVDNAFLLTFNHIKKYFDKDGNLYKSDTVQIERLDYAFNTIIIKKTKRLLE